MTKRILIDAVHPEEVRVALADDSKLEEFDFESTSKKQIKSNIYLGKITRVEPSLQAAFVEYGGNKQGFLPFSEVHFDYFQIPVEDREKLLAEIEAENDARLERGKEQEERNQDRAKSKEKDLPNKEIEKSSFDSGEDNKSAGSMEADSKGVDSKDFAAKKKVVKKAAADKASASSEKKSDVADGNSADKPKTSKKVPAKKRAAPKVATKEADAVDVKDVAKIDATKESVDSSAKNDDKPTTKAMSMDDITDDVVVDIDGNVIETKAKIADVKSENKEDKKLPKASAEVAKLGLDEVSEISIIEDSDSKLSADSNDSGDEEIEEFGDDDMEIIKKSTNLYNRYSIQEVLKRGQIVLVQVIKEERGNKGASLTTYISIAGRYCVLMPNTDRAGGVSRRISDYDERKRLKSIVTNVDKQKGSSLIVRTAGVGKKEEEIGGDFEYLSGLWNNIKKETLSSEAPALIHEEGNLIKRSLRDMYRDNVDEVIIEGEKGFNSARNFIAGITPDQVERITQHKDSVPLFKQYGIDKQLDALYDNNAKLESGGSIVITPTEALVSIDVNSGKATKERCIEDTALKTNLEAAEEIARQLRLRDLAGLVVIDFIDMREYRNRRAVEKALKDALKADRAKIQVGRISTFGLLEMSRQRMRSSLVEASTTTCPRCEGVGMIRSDESIAITLLRAIEAEAAKNDQDIVRIKASIEAAFYLLNSKRSEISALEESYKTKIFVDHDHSLVGEDFVVDKSRPRRKNNKNQRNNRNQKSSANKNQNQKPQGQEQAKNQGQNPNQKKQGQGQKVNSNQNNDSKDGKKPSPRVKNSRNKKPYQNKKPSDDKAPIYKEPQIQDSVAQEAKAQQEMVKGEKTRQSKQKPYQNKNDKSHDKGNIVPSVAENKPQNEAAPKADSASKARPASDDGDSSKLKGLWKKITQ